jgi:hypothetical protein
MRGVLLAILGREEFQERIATELHDEALREQIGAPAQASVRITDLRLAMASDLENSGDLQERSLLVSLPSIPEEERREEAAFWADFEAARPRIFGALLEGVSAALRNSESVQLEKMPRMADFAVGATAMEGCFGWEAGSFVEVYETNRQQASEALLANEPLADAIKETLRYAQMMGEPEVYGTATELLNRLGSNVDDDTKRSKAWPRGPQVLSRRLRRLAPALRSVGIEYTENEEGHDRKKVKTLRKLVGDDEEARDAGEEACEGEAGPEGEATDGEEEREERADSGGKVRRIGNPFAKFRYDFDDPGKPEDTDTE